MSKLRLSYNDAQARSMMGKFNKAMSKSAQRAVILKSAHIWRGRMINRTPKRWTGQTRRGWVVKEIRTGVFELTNTTKTMLGLEKGTKAHGPKSAGVKCLFIPLTRRAASAGARGVVEANKAAAGEVAWHNYGMNVTGGQKKKPKLPFIPGKDFLFAKRVKGIKAMWIVRSARYQARITQRLLMRQYIIDALSG